MCKGEAKKTNQFRTILAICLPIVIILYLCINFCYSLVKFGVHEEYELDTKEKLNYSRDLFHIKESNNTGSYKMIFQEGIMALQMNDVKDIHKLCFEDLAYYGITEEQYNEKFELSTDECESDSSLNYKEYPDWVRFEVEKDKDYGIIVCIRDDIIYCQIRTGIDFDALEKMRSME